MTEKKSKEVKISKIILEIEGQQIEVTPEGAEKLHKALQGMFPDDKVVIQEIIYPKIIRNYPRPYWEWYPPYTTGNNMQYTNEGIGISYSVDSIME